MMQGIGNDIVDLGKARTESNSKRKGYLEKICTENEQQLIHQAKDSFQLLWVLWTMKESTYKIINRNTGLRNYAPLSFQCELSQLTATEATGTIICYGQLFHSHTTLKDGYIHSVAASLPAQLEKVNIMYPANSKSYKEEFNQSAVAYQLHKNTAGLPEMTHRTEGTRHAVSVSHHGRYLAIAYSDSPLSAD